MITFKISFMLAFSLKTKSEGNKKQTKKHSGQENLGNESKKNKTKKGEKGKTEENIPESPNYLFEVDKTIGVAHIEYELIPNKCKYEIDVKCWGAIAKVFTIDGQITLKTLVRNEMAWVPVCLEHYIKNLSVDEIKSLRDYIVKFDIVNNVHKLGNTATSDKCRKFYAYVNEVELDRFVEVYEVDPNLQENNVEQSKETLKKETQDFIKKTDSSKKDFMSRLDYPDNYDMIYEIISKHCSGIDIECKDFVLPCSLPLEVPKKVKIHLDQNDTKKDKTKSSKDKIRKSKDKKSGNKKTQAENIAVSVPAEVFLTDPQWTIYKGENNNCAINNVYILFFVDQLLSRAQKLLLDPLVIKIKKLSNLPVNILNKIGITSIYTTYNIPFIANCKSIEKPVAKKIKFNEAHIFFNDSVSKLKLIEFIQTRKLHIEIYGTKTLPSSGPNPLLFGNKADDTTISKIIPLRIPDKTTDVDTASLLLLAVCTYDISSLVQNIWDFKEKGQCHAPGLTLYQKCMGFYDGNIYCDMRNVNEINLSANYPQITNPILEEILLSFGTTLKVEVYLMAPQTASLILLRIPNTFKRFLLILFSWELAKNLLTGIIKHNQEILSEKAGSTEKDIEFSDVITGFLIDNGNSYTIFVEGLSTGFILNIENITITNYETERGKFFLNTETVFEKRLYSSFIMEGLMIITLKIPLYNILSNQRVYWDGNVPFPCLEALKKLCLLFYSSPYKSILQFNLLPKPEELLSLNLEWGVPLMVKK